MEQTAGMSFDSLCLIMIPFFLIGPGKAAGVPLLPFPGLFPNNQGEKSS
jgi:hypothetical protein